jgi:O-antigen/teichoic acid export membrane protein
MVTVSQVAVRNAGLLLAQRGLHVSSGFLFAALVPRLMGPDLYGRYALVTSLAIWFALFSSLGLTQVIGRYVSHLNLQGDSKKLKKLFGNLLTIDLASGGLVAGLYLLLTILWFQELELSILAIMAAAVLVRAVTHLIYALFLGLNQAARWGMGDVMRGWILLFLLLPGYYLVGLRGACLGLLLTELVVLSVGVWWARSHLSWTSLRLDMPFLAPYLRFGVIFFASHLLGTAFLRSGETLVQLFSGDYMQVSYFGLAHSVYLTIGSAVSQLTLAFAPLLTGLLAQGQDTAIRQWVGRLLTWLAMLGVLAVFGVVLLGDDLVPLVLGHAYRPVVINLLALTVTLPALALSSVGGLLGLTYERPKVVAAAAGVRLAVLWVLGPILIVWRGSLGACLAVFAATVISAGLLTWRMRDVMAGVLKRWALPIGLGGLFLPLIWLRSSWPVNVLLYGIFVAGYGSAVLVLRAVTPGEIAALWRAIGPRGWTAKVTA